jgi:hypothetical protein
LEIYDYKSHKSKIDLFPLLWCNPLLKMRNMYLKMVELTKGDHRKKKTRRKKKVHKCLYHEFAPPYNANIEWT